MANNVNSDFLDRHGGEFKQFFYVVAKDDYDGEFIRKNLDEFGKLIISDTRDDWSCTIKYRCEDTFANSVIVRYKDVQCFTMIHKGRILRGDKKEVYDCLLSALTSVSPSHPWIAPEKFLMGELNYNNTPALHSGIEKFSGCEEICNQNGVSFYEGSYSGGFCIIGG